MIAALRAEFLVCEIGKGEKVKQQPKMDVESGEVNKVGRRLAYRCVYELSLFFSRSNGFPLPLKNQY